MATGRIDTVIGRNLRTRRGELGASQAAIAAAMGLGWTKSTVAAVEAGRRRLSLDETALLARALGTDLPALLAGDQDTPLLDQVTLGQVRRLLCDRPSDPPVAPVPAEEIEAGLSGVSAAQLERLAADRLSDALGRKVEAAEAAEIARDAFDGRTISEARQQAVEQERQQARAMMDHWSSVLTKHEEEFYGAIRDKTLEVPVEVMRKQINTDRDRFASAKAQVQQGPSPQTVGHLTRRLLAQLELRAEALAYFERRPSTAADPDAASS